MTPEDCPCPGCGEYSLRIEHRTTLRVKPLGTWSLAGMQNKVSATEESWAWLVCDSCGIESREKK